jgi:Tol biopolymer transport system component
MKKSGKLLILALLVAVVFLIGGCTTSSDTESVVGIVTDASTNQPIEGVNVTVGGKSSLTNEHGEYGIDEIDKGTYTLTAEKTGFQDFSASVTVEEKKATLKNFAMTPVAVTTVTGTVVNFADGVPVSGATVAIGANSVTTGADGTYTLSNVAAGKQTITATAGGQENYEAEFTVTADVANTHDIEMEPAEGRYQVFQSRAANLVPFAIQGNFQIYVRDMYKNTTILVTVGTDGQPGFRKCEERGGCGGTSMKPSITPSGRYVVFESNFTNLVDIEYTGVKGRQVFLRDLREGVTTLVSMGYDEKMGDHTSGFAKITPDGKYVVYSSKASNIIEGVESYESRQIYLYDTESKTSTLVSVGFEPAVAGSKASKETEVIHGGDACSNQPDITPNGRYVTFQSQAVNLTEETSACNMNIYVRDMVDGETTLVSKVIGGELWSWCTKPSISEDGRYIAFASTAGSLVEGVSEGSAQIYLWDKEGVTTLVSVGHDDEKGSSDSLHARISSDGRYVAFYSYANNLVEGEINGIRKIYVRDRQEETTEVISTGYEAETQADGESRRPILSRNGRFVLFESCASNLLDEITNGYWQVYLKDRQTGTLTKVSVSPFGTEGDNDSATWGCD